ncbi:hypothetical protein F66182_2954 [Fusarium sp. NRRL 66182]|nr:hypothetical protein F66182_2954 [Fusarium sp. NRRL 66182]
MPPKPVRPAPTHFVCIPLAGPQLARSLAAFRTEVTNPANFGVPPGAVRPLGTMHLTLGVMSLKDEGAEQAAELLKGLKLREILSRVKSASSSEERLSITLKGLHAMHTHKNFDSIRATFQEAGLMAKEDRPLLLHATVVNTIYVKGGRGKKREKLTLDARDVINLYDNHVWLEDMLLEKVALCRMGAKKIEGTDDEAYEVEAEVEF